MESARSSYLKKIVFPLRFLLPTFQHSTKCCAVRKKNYWQCIFVTCGVIITTLGIIWYHLVPFNQSFPCHTSISIFMQPVNSAILIANIVVFTNHDFDFVSINLLNVICYNWKRDQLPATNTLICYKNVTLTYGIFYNIPYWRRPQPSNSVVS